MHTIDITKRLEFIELLCTQNFYTKQKYIHVKDTQFFTIPKKLKRNVHISTIKNLSIHCHFKHFASCKIFFHNYPNVPAAQNSCTKIALFL
jgi:hypothetical protein